VRDLCQVSHRWCQHPRGFSPVRNWREPGAVRATDSLVTEQGRGRAAQPAARSGPGRRLLRRLRARGQMMGVALGMRSRSGTWARRKRCYLFLPAVRTVPSRFRVRMLDGCCSGRTASDLGCGCERLPWLQPIAVNICSDTESAEPDCWAWQGCVRPSGVCCFFALLDGEEGRC